MKSLKYFLLLLPVLVLSSYIYSESISEEAPDLSISTDEDNKRDEVLIDLIFKGLDEAHFQPLSLDDDFSAKAYDLYLERLDYSKRYLIAEDVEKMAPYKLKIDDEVKNRTFEFYTLSAEIIKNRIEESKVFYQEILEEPFDFTTNETIEVDYEKLAFVKDKAALKERWRKLLKYQTLARLADMIEEQEQAAEKSDTVTIKSVAELEVEAREKVKKNYVDFYDRMDDLNDKDRQSVYLNSVINVYGPHTSYFPPQDKENFDISMSGQLEGIGARLIKKDGYIKVSEIVPGSASYRQGDLKAGDLITKVAQGNEEPVDVVDADIDDAVKLIRGKKGTEVRLTVKKIDGTIQVIPIVRDVVLIEETYARSVILKKDNNKSVGYIHLPKFYADFSKKDGRSCARDVEKEVEKLKSEGVSGIILDLRNNGGGSLQDVVDMAGLFIEKGPIVQVKAKRGAPYVLKDDNSEVQYDGPLVVMVNNNSASASEIMAAAIQDYQRGIIIGSNSSFGKGTVQRFFGLDDFVIDRSLTPLGAVKITTQKFYRVNGGATQLKGVTPDIVVPDIFSFIETGEKEHDHVMKWDEISAVEYKQWKPSYNLDKVRKNSEARIKDNNTFQLIQENAKWLKGRRDITNFSLNLEKYRAEQKKTKEEAERYDDIDKVIEGLQVMNIKADLPAIDADTVKQERNKKWLERIEKDAYINEALMVIDDMK